MGLQMLFYDFKSQINSICGIVKNAIYSPLCPPHKGKNNFRKLFLALMGRTQWGINRVFDDTAKTVDLRLKIIKHHLKAHIQLTLTQKEKSAASKLTARQLFVF